MVYGVYRPWMRRPNTTIINHNYMNLPNGCGYGTGGCGGGISNKAMAWILGITGGVGLLGGILGGISQNRQARAEAQEQKLLQQEQDAKKQDEATLKNLQKIYNEYEWLQMDGKFMAFDKETDKFIGEGSDFDSCKKAIEKYRNENANNPTETEENKKLDELERTVAERDATIQTLREQLAARENGSTPGDDGTGSLKPVTGDTTLTGEYTWGKMGATGDKYKGQTAEYIAREVLGDGASEEDIANMTEKIKNMNPNAFEDGKVTNPSRLNVPEIKTNATGTPTSTSTETTEKGTTTETKWERYESNKWYSQDTVIKRTNADGSTTEYKIGCSDLDNLNDNKLVHTNDGTIKLKKEYHDKDWATEDFTLKGDNNTTIKLTLDKTTGRFMLKDITPTAYLEDYLNNPEEYTNTEEKTSNTEGGVAGTTSGSETGNSNVIPGKVTYGKDNKGRKIASVTVTNSSGISKTFTIYASSSKNMDKGKLMGQIVQDPDFAGQKINLEE